MESLFAPDENKIDNELGNSIKALIDMLKKSTTLSTSEILSISLLLEDKHYQPFVVRYIQMKKYKKGKFTKTILKALELITKGIPKPDFDKKGLF